MKIELDEKYIKADFSNDLANQEAYITNQIQGGAALIIGGAGTIGSSYVKELVKFKPAIIVVVDTNENGLTELTRDLRSSSLLDYGPTYITYPVNLLSSVFDKIMQQYTFDLVANFAAHKHVRSEKDPISIEALVRNNVYGAVKLLRLCMKSNIKFFFSVSTDKAANPVNIMGASKSLMEKLILSCATKFRVTTARFANVAFSNGSLLDGFIYRLRKNQPLSCPSDIKRFFVTPEQSGQICLLATFLGETGNIFFPKLDFHNDQIYFKDIAIDFLKDNGFEPYLANSEDEAKSFDIEAGHGQYPVYFFKTDTSGEKSYEEFYTEEEDTLLEKYNSLGVIRPDSVTLDFDEVVNDFENLFNSEHLTKRAIVEVIAKYVTDFEHIETGKHLDQKM